MSRQVVRNITLNGHRTSLRLEADVWEALEEICVREGYTLNQLGSMINKQRQESSMAAAVRVFVLMYFRSAATELGHENAGHGTLEDIV
ncbi:ribbon-helix-helix domain-containing protein [Kiloniella sp. b19]|uniref:ribbon-helix-helix domain-containing protein n=1 Tax=Kiloniella sp. GXU_MW_B19 TaxID=3141326 RepID=UPI0031D9A0B4